MNNEPGSPVVDHFPLSQEHLPVSPDSSQCEVKYAPLPAQDGLEEVPQPRPTTCYPKLKTRILTILLELAKLTGIIIAHLVCLVLAVGWTSLWVTGIREVVSSPETPSKTPQPPESAFDAFFEKMFLLLWSLFACVAVAIGACATGAAAVSMIYWTAHLLAPSVKPAMGRMTLSYYDYVHPSVVASRGRVRYLSSYITSRWLTSTAVNTDEDEEMGFLDDAESTPSKTRATESMSATCGSLSAVSPLFLAAVQILAIVIGHGVAVFVVIAWTSMWFFGIVKAWQSAFDTDGIGLFMRMFTIAFFLVWTCGAVAAIGAGLYGVGLLLASLGRSLRDVRRP